MATNTPDIMAVIDEQAVEVSKATKTVTPGTQEYSNLIKDLAQLGNAHANLERTRVQKEYNDAQLIEQNRMNTEQLLIDKERLEMEQNRFAAEQVYREKQFKLSFGEIFINAARDILIPGWGLTTYSRAFATVAAQEYMASDGNSMVPPAPVKRELERLQPKKQF